MDSRKINVLTFQGLRSEVAALTKDTFQIKGSKYEVSNKMFID